MIPSIASQKGWMMQEVTNNYMYYLLLSAVSELALANADLRGGTSSGMLPPILVMMNR